MNFSIDATTVKSTLKRISVGLPAPSEYLPRTVSIQVREEGVAFATLRATAKLNADDAHVVIDQVGNYTVDYLRLLNAIDALRRTRLTLLVRGKALLLTCSSPRSRQVIVAREQARQAKRPALPTPGETYTSQTWESTDCLACGKSSAKRVNHTYQIGDLHIQEVKLPEGAVSDLFAPIAHVPTKPSDDGNQALTGMYIGLKDGRFTVFAGNRSGAVRSSLAIEGSGSWKHGVLLPAKELFQAIKVIPPTSEVVIQAIFSQHRHILSDGVEVVDATTTSQIAWIQLSTQDWKAFLPLLVPSEKIPNYQGLFPKMWNTRATVSKKDLREALETVAPVTDDSEAEGGAVFLFGPRLRIEARFKESTEVAYDEIQVLDIVGTNISVRLDPQDVMGALTVMETENVSFEIASPSSPIVVRPSTPPLTGIETSYVLGALKTKEKAAA